MKIHTLLLAALSYIHFNFILIAIAVAQSIMYSRLCKHLMMGCNCYYCFKVSCGARTNNITLFILSLWSMPRRTNNIAAAQHTYFIKNVISFLDGFIFKIFRACILHKDSTKIRFQCHNKNANLK